MKTYKNFDTDEIWTEEEIKAEYKYNFKLIEQYPNFEDYLKYLIDLGKQHIGGIIEIENN